jgi:hypothetical protein
MLARTSLPQDGTVAHAVSAANNVVSATTATPDQAHDELEPSLRMRIHISRAKDLAIKDRVSTCSPFVQTQEGRFE